MGEPDLSFIKSDIDLSEVPPLNRRRVVAFVNCYILKMTDFLNDFANRAERLILESERQLHAVDIKLQLLEAKLAAIPDPGTKDVKDSVKSSTADVAKNAITTELTVNASTVPTSSVVASSSQQSVAAALETAADIAQSPAPARTEVVTVEQNTLLVKDDPAFAKYFKMLKLGVMEPAVKQKMQSEGVDPALLDHPNAPSPNSSKASAAMNSPLSQADDSDSSSVSSFSDSD